MNPAGASSSPFKSKKPIQSSIKKPHLLSDQSPDCPTTLSSKTPEKPTSQPPRHLRSLKQVREAAKQLRVNPTASASSDPVDSSNEAPTMILKPKLTTPLPEKYEMLEKFFSSLVLSIRLLGLKGTMSTFTKISRQIECLTDRSFGYSHLAQIKFILPEAVEIKKMLVRDDQTCCMKADLHITLDYSVVETGEKLRSDRAGLLLNKLFRSRLVKFCKTNPEGDDVPLEELPEPFNITKRPTCLNANLKANVGSVSGTLSSVTEPQPMAASLLPKSFKRRFSNQISIQNEEPVKQVFRISNPVTQVDHRLLDVASPVKWSAKLAETPIKKFDLGKKEYDSIDETPVKLVSTPISATPALSARPPVRCLMTPNEESVMSPSKLTRRSTSKRLFDTPVKSKTPPVKRMSTDGHDDDLFDILSDDLLASIKGKELKALEEQNPEISQAKRRKQMIAGLPKLFDMLLFHFHSIKRTVVSKDELMNLITSSQLEIVDQREADEQLRLLRELAPEWIYEKRTSDGDLLLCVNKISSPESIRSRLSEAI